MKHIDYPKFRAVSGKEIIGIKVLLETGQIGVYEAMAMIGKVVVLCSEEMNLLTDWMNRNGAILVENENERIESEDGRREEWDAMQKAWEQQLKTIAMLDALCKELKERMEKLEENAGSGGCGCGGEGDSSGEGGDKPGGDTPGTVVDTKSVFKQCYRKKKEKPERPVGGAYNFETRAFSVPTGWSDNSEYLTGEGDIWMSYTTFMSDGTSTGWSEPIRMVDYDELFGKIEEEMRELYDKILNDAESDLNKILADAAQALADAREKIEAAKGTIEETKKTMEDAKKYLDTLEESIGESGITTNDVNKVMLFSRWYDKNVGSITNLGTELDAMKGTIRSYGERLDTVAGTVTNLESLMDTINGTIGQYGEHINTLDGTVTRVETELNAMKGTVTVFGERIDTVENTVGSVKTEWDAAKAKIESTAEWVDTNKEQVNKAMQDIDGMNARIDLIATAANTAKNEASAAKVAIDGLNASIDLTVEKKVGDAIAAGNFEITPEKILMAIANSEGAGAAIIAALNGDTSEIKISADKIMLNGEVIARLLEAQRIVINNGTTVFEPDGSGQTAGGNIKWDKDGNITLGKDILTIKPDGSFGDLKVPGKPTLEESTDSFIGADGNKIFLENGFCIDNDRSVITPYVVNFEGSGTESPEPGKTFINVFKIKDFYLAGIAYTKNQSDWNYGLHTIGLFKSIDGTNWTFIRELKTCGLNVYGTFNAACLGNTIVVSGEECYTVGGNMGYKYYSTDGGTTWQVGNGKAFQVLSVLGNRFFGIYNETAEGILYISKDGINWESVYDNVYGFVYYNNKYIVSRCFIIDDKLVPSISESTDCKNWNGSTEISIGSYNLSCIVSSMFTIDKTLFWNISTISGITNRYEGYWHSKIGKKSAMLITSKGEPFTGASRCFVSDKYVFVQTQPNINGVKVIRSTPVSIIDALNGY